MSNHDDLEFIRVVANQEPNNNDLLMEAFLAVKGSIAYIATWIEDFHNIDVFDNEDEIIAMTATFTKIKQIMEEEIQ